MYLIKSEVDLLDLLKAAANRQVEGAPSIEVTACYVEPDTPVDIIDRLEDSPVHPDFFVMAEYAGEEPQYQHDGRRYRRRFRYLQHYPNVVVTFASSVYYLRPISVVLESRRTADSEGPGSLSYRILVCDTENRHGLPAYLKEVLSELEENEKATFEPPTERTLAGSSKP